MAKGKSMARLTASLSRPNLNRAVPFIALTLAVGAAVVVISMAAGTPIAFEPESGTLAAGATTTSITGQSGSGAVKFATAGTPTPTASPGACTSAIHTPGGPDGMGGCWPGPNTTGYPHGLPGDPRTPVSLTAYTGPCTITTAGTVIDSKTINCGIDVRAANVTIKNSKINGSIFIAAGQSFSVSISDVEIDGGNNAGTDISEGGYTATRLDIHGGNRSGYCASNCSWTDSYVHGQFKDLSGTFHESGLRMEQNGTFQHNTISCDAPEVPPEGGCSADVSGYGDFATIQNNTFDKNLFVGGNDLSYCVYAGSSPSKPYPNANHIVFSNNIWQRGTRPSERGTFVCGYYGPVSDFNSTAPGNVWTNNKWDDGTNVAPDG
jgi:hypothetical protein